MEQKLESLQILLSSDSENHVVLVRVTTASSVLGLPVVKNFTKYHSTKAYPLLKLAPRHKNAWGSGGIAPCILNLSTRWCEKGKDPGTNWAGVLLVPRAGLDEGTEENIRN
jgi:hypothetical protein